jgi:hypothetical protein
MSIKWFRTGKLVEALVKNHLVTSINKGHQWVTRAEQAKKISPYKMPTATGTAQRRFRQEDIDDIIKAFSVGGVGYWIPKPIKHGDN